MRYYLKISFSIFLLGGMFSFQYKHSAIPEQSSGIAFYKFLHIRDTTNTKRTWGETFALAFDHRKSVYLSYTKVAQDSMMQARLEQNIRTSSRQIDMGTLVQTTPGTIYFDRDINQLILKNRFNDIDYLIQASLPKINWKIETETKNVLGFTCQKATGSCYGRVYTAWFTTDIPESLGPWKLHGLPGLILEAYDLQHRIEFICTKVVLNTRLPKYASLETPAGAIVTTQKEYDRMEKAYKEGAYTEGDFVDGATVEKVTVGGTSSRAQRKKISINYPLELTP